MRTYSAALALVALLAVSLAPTAAADPIGGANARTTQAMCNGEPVALVAPSHAAAVRQMSTSSGVITVLSIEVTDPQTQQVFFRSTLGQTLAHQSGTLVTCTFPDRAPGTGQMVQVTILGFSSPRR